jgi:hypothetical protein
VVKIRANISKPEEVWCQRRVTYQVGRDAEKAGYLTGAYKVLSPYAIKVQVQPDEGKRKVWVTWAWGADDD